MWPVNRGGQQRAARKVHSELPRGQLVLVIMGTLAGRHCPRGCNSAEGCSPAEFLGWDPQIGPSISQRVARDPHKLLLIMSSSR